MASDGFYTLLAQGPKSAHVTMLPPTQSVPWVEAERCIQLTAAFSLVVHSLAIRPLFGRPVPATRFRDRLGFTSILGSFLQLGIAVSFFIFTAAEIMFQSQDHIVDLMPLVLYASSGMAAAVNIVGIALGQDSAPRGFYHIVACLCWTRLNVSLTASITSVQLFLPWALATAFLLDVFHSTLPRRLPPDLSHMNLSDHITYTWLSHMIGATTALSFDALPEVDMQEDFQEYHARIYSSATLSQHSAAVNLFWGFIAREHRRQLVISSVLRLVDDTSKFALPWILQSLLSRPTSRNVAVMFCARIVGTLCGNYSGCYLRKVSARYKAALCAALHAKALRLGDDKDSAQGPDLATLGEVDSHNLYRGAQTYPDIWTFPFQVLLCLGGLAYLLPPQSFVAVIVVTSPLFHVTAKEPGQSIAFPLTASLLNSIGAWMSRNMAAKDHRTKLIVNTLGAIQSIKMHAWESVLFKAITERRAQELKTLQSMAMSTSGLVCCMQGLPSLLTLASFGVIIYLGHDLDTEIVFTALILFTMLNASLMQLSGLGSVVQSVAASAGRIQTFLNLSEARLAALDTVQPDASCSSGVVNLTCRRLTWPGSSADLLTDASLNIKLGSLAVIAGKVGAGKSTLLLAILRHFEQSKPSRHLRIAYVPQKPILLRGSIRDNILFGTAYDARRYAQVIDACCLELDFERLPNGDETRIIGSSTLSGGQVARIALARAIYSGADIYLLDDPIAAIDVKVESHITKRLFSQNGLLSNSTRILCTSTNTILRHADSIHELVNGTISSQHGRQVAVDDLIEFESPPPVASASEETPQAFIMTPNTLVIDVEIANDPSDDPEPQDGPPDHSPHHQRSPIMKYILAAKPSSWAIAASVLLLARLSSVVGTWILKMMAAESNPSLLVRDMGLFALSSVSQSALFFLFVLLLYKLCVIPASSRLHKGLLSATLSQGISFFQTTPTGEILNLFTNDISRIDGSLNSSIASLMGQYTNLALACGILVASVPLSIGFVIPLLAICYRVQSTYLDKLRDLRQMDLSSRAPLLDYLQESKEGRQTFSAFKVTDARLARFTDYLAFNLPALFSLSCLDLWLGVRLEVSSVVLQILALGLMLVTGVDTGTVGFAMTYIFQVTSTLNVIAKISAVCEADAVSVARVDEYSRRAEKGELQVDGEEVGLYSDSGPIDAWPSHGKVEFRSVSARHRPGLPVCIESITATILPGEKVAVVGRTGAGKSSMILSLLRMMDQTAGQILIDDVNIANLSLSRLRRSLALIPQTQVVLPGSVRQNIDVLGLHGDPEILQCLEASGSASVIVNHFLKPEKFGGSAGIPSPLDIVIEETSNLSTGERQSLALARAILQKSKILVLDEATSGMDASAEAHAHGIVFEKLVDTTVIAVMHRLDLTFHYDKIMVIDQGKLVAFDTPASLLARKQGPYFSMIEEDAALLSDARKHFGFS